MPELYALNFKKYGNKFWTRAQGLAYASGQKIVPLVHSELTRAVSSFPVAFIPQRGKYILGAVMGLETKDNLLVDAQGRWRSTYIPAYLRGHPFYPAEAGEGKLAVGVDESSGLITDGPEGHPFYTDEGQPTKALQDVVNFVKDIASKRLATDKACQVLAKHKLIQPWPGKQGLYQINENALNSIDNETLSILWSSGSLMLAFGQLYSRQRMPFLEKLAELDRPREQEETGLDEYDSFDIDWEKIKI